jgi:GT2 family glycosyltransferase
MRQMTMLFPEDKKIDLSISVVSYNVKEMLRQCLRSIIAHTRGIKYEIIVVDNGSQDGTVEMLGTDFPSVRLIVNRQNRGFAAAQNMGLGRGRGRYLFSLDSDTYIKNDVFSIMVRFMDQQADAGAAGAKLLSPQGVRQYSRRRFPPSIWPVIYRGSFLRNILPPTRQVRYYEMSDVVLKSEAEVDWVYGGNIIFRRRALEQVGLFDERFFIYCEDVDISYRMQEKGWKRYFIPGAEIFHYGQQGTRQLRIRSYLRHVSSYVKLFRKYNWKLDERYKSNLDRREGGVEIVFIIVNRDKKQLLNKCLQAIKADPPKATHLIVVVDDASRDGSMELIKQQHPEVRWIANETQKGYVFALNQALSITESNYLVTVPLKPGAVHGQFQQLYEFLKPRPRAGMAGLLQMDGNDFSQHDSECPEKYLFIENCMMMKRPAFLPAIAARDSWEEEDQEFKWQKAMRKQGWGHYYLLNL